MREERTESEVVSRKEESEVVSRKSEAKPATSGGAEASRATGVCSGHGPEQTKRRVGDTVSEAKPAPKSPDHQPAHRSIGTLTALPYSVQEPS